MKGLEHSTFRMASVVRGHRAIQGRMETTLAGGSRIFPFFPLPRCHGLTTEAGFEGIPHPRPPSFGVEQVRRLWRGRPKPCGPPGLRQLRATDGASAFARGFQLAGTRFLATLTRRSTN
jgi:hypothetical protein